MHKIILYSKTFTCIHGHHNRCKWPWRVPMLNVTIKKGKDSWGNLAASDIHSLKPA